MVEQYIGIENELITFEEGKVVGFGEYFDSLVKDTDYSKSNSSIRTPEGLGFYVDGSEIEILTPPVAINKGFATRLTDLLMIGRDRVINSSPELEHTGYSMHWNLTDTENINVDINVESYLKGIAVPFHLFGLTPLSIGLNLRAKEGNPPRYELLGDSLINEEQIKANALLLGAYSQARSQKHESPFFPEIPNLTNTLFLPDGRYDKIKIIHPQHSGDSDVKTISAQQYLELFYHWLEPFVRDLGTKREVNNLEGFISGDKKLEFDNFKYFAFIKDEGGKDGGGTYLPIRTLDKNLPGQVLRASGKKRKIPLEGKLIGEYVKKMKDKIKSINWEKIDFYRGHDPSSLHGIEEIYNHVRTLNPNLPDYHKANGSEQIKPNSIDEIKVSKSMKYDDSKDNFVDGRKRIIYCLMQEFNKRKKDILINILMLASIGGLIGIGGSFIYDKIKEKSQVNSIIEQYKQVNREGIDNAEHNFIAK